MRCLPGEDGTHGFFVAVFEKSIPGVSEEDRVFAEKRIEELESKRVSIKTEMEKVTNPAELKVWRNRLMKVKTALAKHRKKIGSDGSSGGVKRDREDDNDEIERDVKKIKQ